jgi:sec-independent protein translocase protein TatB
MLDFSFSELLLCFVVALVVLGPERLPAVARAVGRWTGRAKTYMRNLSEELDKEAHVSELKKQLEDAQRMMREQSQSMQTQARKLADEIKPDTTIAPKSAEPTDRSPDHG